MTASSHRSQLVYDDLASVAEMSVDARAAGANLRLPMLLGTPAPRAVPLTAMVGREEPKRQLEIPEAARRLADALELHLG